jgi:hypothetical protein
MKIKGLSLALILAAFVAVWAAAPPLAHAGLEFKEKRHDFGRIGSLEKKEHVFYFENSGTEPVKILSVTPSCGCAAVLPEKTSVAPGERGDIKVVFDPAGKTGAHESTVTVAFEDGTSQTLGITADIKTLDGPASAEKSPQPSIRTKPKVVSLGKMRQGEMKLYNVVIGNEGEGDLFVSNLVGNDKNGNPLSRHPIAKGKKVEVKFFYRAEEKGRINDYAVIYSNDPARPVVRIKLKGIVE